MINGHDVEVEMPVDSVAIDVLLRTVRAAWPHAVVENGGGNTCTIGDAIRLRWILPTELFIYETRDAYESWTASGLTDENGDKLMALTLESDCISFVVSAQTAPSAQIVDVVIEAIKMNNQTFRNQTSVAAHNDS